MGRRSRGQTQMAEQKAWAILATPTVSVPSQAGQQARALGLTATVIFSSLLLILIGCYVPSTDQSAGDLSSV